MDADIVHETIVVWIFPHIEDMRDMEIVMSRGIPQSMKGFEGFWFILSIVGPILYQILYYIREKCSCQYC